MIERRTLTFVSQRQYSLSQMCVLFLIRLTSFRTSGGVGSHNLFDSLWVREKIGSLVEGRRSVSGRAMLADFQL